MTVVTLKLKCILFIVSHGTVKLVALRYLKEKNCYLNSNNIEWEGAQKCWIKVHVLYEIPTCGYQNLAMQNHLSVCNRSLSFVNSSRGE